MRIAVVVLFGSAAFAQSTGSITGTVLDLAGEAVANAPVQATNVATKAVFKATSSDKGSYTLAPLPAGSYTVSVAAPTFNPAQQDVAVAAGQTVRFDIHLVDIQLNTLGDGREFYADLMARHKTPSGPTPRTANGRPDLSGVWHASLPVPGNPEPLPWAQAVVRERMENNNKDWPQGFCLPAGVTVYGGFLPFRVVQTPAILVMISEVDVPNYRQIFLDGRAHPKNLEPTWMGHSVGHWEKDTLAVDTVGFNGKAWLDLDGHPYTEKTHITERWRRPDLGHLEVEFTIDDPTAYAKPWTIKRVSDLAPKGDEVQELICTENNKDPAHLVGK
jgi:hypothetical protein